MYGLGFGFAEAVAAMANLERSLRDLLSGHNDTLKNKNKPKKTFAAKKAPHMPHAVKPIRRYNRQR